MLAETFEQYCSRETIRQTLRGHRVPHVNQHVAHTQWLQQARKVWMAATGGAEDRNEASTFGGVFPIPARDTMLRNADTLASPPPTMRSATDEEAPRPLTFPPQQEVARLVQCVELLLRLCFLDANNRSILSSLLALRPEITHLQESRTLGEGSDQHPHVHTLYELLSFRRLMRSWSQLPRDKRIVCVATSLVIARAYTSDAFIAFQKELEKSIDVDRANPGRLLELAVKAALDVPWQFPETAAAIRAIHPDSADPNAVPKHQTAMATGGCVAEAESNDPIEDCDDDAGEVAVVVPKERAVVPLQRLPVREYVPTDFRKQIVVPKTKRDDSPDRRLGDILVNGTTPTEQPAVATDSRKKVRIEAPAATTIRPTTAAATPAASAAHKGVAPHPQVRATAAHPFPCPSKYHAKYSSVDKHASRECSFCSICHMMEFLFNGCRTTCCWRHEPTERKVKLHLGKHQAVLKLALRRLADWSTGANLDPIDI